MPDRDAINFSVMRKLGLVEPFDSPAEAAGALGLLDAAVLPAAYYALFVRSKNASPAAIVREVQAGRHMARLPGLKGNLQVVSRALMPHVYAFTKDDRESRARALTGGWGIDAGEYDRVRKAIVDTLGDREKTLGQLKTGLPVNVARDVTRRRGKRTEKSTNVAVVAQAMVQRWELLRGGIGRTPWEDPGRYSLIGRRFGPMKLDESRAAAAAALARTYVEKYGPASAEDFAWWAGLTKGDAAAVFGRLQGIKALEVPGMDGQFYAAADDLPESRRKPGLPLRMLATDDPYVKAYSHRGRFVPALYQGQLISKFGEASPVVLLDGVVHGLWSLNGRTCVVEMVAGPGAAEGAIRAAAGGIGRFFTGGPVDVVFTAYVEKA